MSFWKAAARGNDKRHGRGCVPIAEPEFIRSALNKMPQIEPHSGQRFLDVYMIKQGGSDTIKDNVEHPPTGHGGSESD